MARPGSILMIGAFGILPSKRRCSRQSILTVVSHREPSSRHIHCAFLYMSSCFLCELHWHSYWWCIINLWAVEQIKRVFDDKSMVTFLSVLHKTYVVGTHIRIAERRFYKRVPTSCVSWWNPELSSETLLICSTATGDYKSIYVFEVIHTKGVCTYYKIMMSISCITPRLKHKSKGQKYIWHFSSVKQTDHIACSKTSICY